MFLREFTLFAFTCAAVDNTRVTVVADGLPQSKRVLCHFINHACNEHANCSILWVTDEEGLNRPFYRLNRDVKRGEQLTVDYRGFDFSNGCLCFGCTGLTTYCQEDYAKVIGRLCSLKVVRPKAAGLFTREEIKVGSCIGFFVGKLIPFDLAQGQSFLNEQLYSKSPHHTQGTEDALVTDRCICTHDTDNKVGVNAEQGVLGQPGTMLVGSKPPWAEEIAWKMATRARSEAVVDARNRSNPETTPQVTFALLLDSAFVLIT